jgi:hypothetical protein
MVERRKKKRDNGDTGKAAGKKRARPRRGRSNTEGTGAPDPPAGGLGGQEEPSTGIASTSSTPSAAEDQGQAPRVPLPGEIYQRANEWWWRVKLPGEDRAKPRPLHSGEAPTAAADRETAGKVAFALWERAVQEDATRQIKQESTEKIERLKAQFLDRVRHFTELVETANAKIEAEAKARAEAEAKLAQMIQAAPPDAAPVPPPATGTCGCCEATGIARACLTQIASGQFLCPRCLAALHADAAQTDPHVPS